MSKFILIKQIIYFTKLYKFFSSNHLYIQYISFVKNILYYITKRIYLVWNKK